MIYKIQNEQPFQVLSDSFSVSPSESGYVLQISADGREYSDFLTVPANTTKQVVNMNNGNFYRLSGNTSEVTINWMRECKSSGGSGGGSGSTVTWNQVVTGGTKIAEISIDGASTNVYAPEGGDSKSLVNFDETSQADRAALYTELKAINDGGSGNTINSNYDFYKTLNNNQGVKFEYYGFDSANTLVLGAVVASGDSSAYEQVVKIQSDGTVQVETNAVGGGGGAQDYVIVEALSAITTPRDGMIAYVPAHTVTMSGYTILDTEQTTFSNYVKRYIPQEDRWSVGDTNDGCHLTYTNDGNSRFTFDSPNVWFNPFSDTLFLKYFSGGSGENQVTVLYDPNIWEFEMNAGSYYYEATADTVTVSSRMYIYKYNAWYEYKGGLVTFNRDFMTISGYADMKNTLEHFDPSEVQFEVSAKWESNGSNAEKYLLKASSFGHDKFWATATEGKYSYYGDPEGIYTIVSILDGRGDPSSWAGEWSIKRAGFDFPTE